jgi:hypothetical protein
MKTKVTRVSAGGGLTLTSTVIAHEKKAKPAKRQVTNHLLIFDRSGSMGWTLSKLVDDVIEWIDKLPQGDTVTVGWFSGEGQRSLVLKGVTLDSTEAKARAVAILNQCRHAVGATCFSEITGDLLDAVRDLEPVSNKFSLVFFTDGCPVVRDVRAEVAALRDKMTALGSRLTSSLFIGYGNYYNRELMGDMAQWGGGAMVHADNIEKFRPEIIDFSTGLGDDPVVEVQMEADPGLLACFSISGKNVVALAQGAAGEPWSVKLPASEEAVVYTLTTSEGRRNKTLGEVETRGLYGAATILSRMGRGDAALEVLGLLGDVGLTNSLSASYTTSEIGNAEAAISAAMSDASRRYLGGKKVGCLPKRDAFCVLDALSLLVEDEDAKFHSADARFRYKRIGVKQEVAEGYSEFEPSESDGSPMRDLTMNETRPNLSILVKLNGTIQLTDECAKHGLAKTFPTHCFRNYTIVKDGALNVDVLPCSMSRETFKTLRRHGAIMADAEFVDSWVYAVELSKLPVMNRAMAEGHRSATTLAKNVLKTYELQGRLKALKYYLEQHDPEKKRLLTESRLSEAAVQYLTDRGVGRNGYSPKTESAKSGDSYMAKEFKVSGKGFSSFPKVEDVVERRKANKGQTASGAMVLLGVEEHEALLPTSGKKIVAALSARIEDLTGELRSIRRKVQAAKFAVLLGNQWFEEFSSREDCSLVVDDVQFSFAVKDVIEEI